MNTADILLVDDDQDACASLADILLDLGYTVDVAYDGLSALATYTRKPCCLALLDYKMPGMDGLELSRLLKGNQPAPEIVLVTAFAPDSAEVADAGVSRVLGKPVDFSILLPLIQRVFGTTDASKPLPN